MLKLLEHMSPLLLCFYLLSSFNVNVAGADSSENPFTPKAYLNRYWNKEISNGLPKPSFFLSKASPLTATQSAHFSKLASQSSLSSSLPSFCSAANLLCFPDLAPSLEKHDNNVKFTSYTDRNFTNYGTDRLGGADEFKAYSDGGMVNLDTFRRYSRDTTGHVDKFDTYAREGNVVNEDFNTYGTNAVGGAGEFSNYATKVNVPKLKFTSYSAETNGRKQTFTTYTNGANVGDESFASYGKNGNGAVNAFTSYGKDYSNVIGSNFNAYGETGNATTDTFTTYAFNGNVPRNNFKNYGDNGHAAVEKFTSYRDISNVGDDSFQSYAKKSNSANVDFENYGKSINGGPVKFTGYGNGAQGNKIGFKGYGVNNTFKDYADKKSVSFASYMKSSQDKPMSMMMMGEKGEKIVNRWIEPGKFFREAMLKDGTVMPMPDIRDKMPKRSFLPRVILSKLPFSTSKITEMKKIFHAQENSSMEGMLVDGVRECERAPAKDETKRCVGSAEDMIDFATSVLGRNIVVRTTANTVGSGKDIVIGSVRGINGGDVTKSVSCHQTLFPYLLYYCHSVPKVRVYEADILDTKTKNKINHGVAICHVDTSSWSATHGAFIALGSKPGKIEVCHWIFENDMTWARAD